MEHAGPAARDLIGRVMATSNANYPENMETCYLVNAPWVFFAVFKGMKKVMSARTVAKVCIYVCVHAVNFVYCQCAFNEFALIMSK